MIKKGIKVKILTGKDKNKEGDVIEIDRKNIVFMMKRINIKTEIKYLYKSANLTQSRKNLKW